MSFAKEVSAFLEYYSEYFQRAMMGGAVVAAVPIEELAELIEQRQSESGVAAKLGLHTGKSGSSSGTRRTSISTMRV